MKKNEKIPLFRVLNVEESATVSGGKRIKFSYNPRTNSFSIKEDGGPEISHFRDGFVSFLGGGGFFHTSYLNDPNALSVTINV